MENLEYAGYTRVDLLAIVSTRGKLETNGAGKLYKPGSLISIRRYFREINNCHVSISMRGGEQQLLGLGYWINRAPVRKHRRKNSARIFVEAVVASIDHANFPRRRRKGTSLGGFSFEFVIVWEISLEPITPSSSLSLFLSPSPLQRGYYEAGIDNISRESRCVR